MDDNTFLIAGIFASIAAGIVWPWVCYGVYTMARWNTNQINYVERPPVVEPADQEHIKAKHGVEK